MSVRKIMDEDGMYDLDELKESLIYVANSFIGDMSSKSRDEIYDFVRYDLVDNVIDNSNRSVRVLAAILENLDFNKSSKIRAISTIVKRANNYNDLDVVFDKVITEILNNELGFNYKGEIDNDRLLEVMIDLYA